MEKEHNTQPKASGEILKHLDLFSGIGGFALAAQWTWDKEYENVGHCEIEPFACKVYHSHFKSECLGDITKIKWQYGRADFITGGFPCQPHSMAGKRKASEDERDLWYECKRAISEIRPKFALFENVSALLTSESGRFFNRVLSDLASIGYDAEWDNIPANLCGAPHRRKRIWIIAYPTKIRGSWKTAFKINRCNNGCKIQWGGYDRESAESKFCRVDDGVPNRVDRLKSLGNAIVPQVAYEIMKCIKEIDDTPTTLP